MHKKSTSVRIVDAPSPPPTPLTDVELLSLDTCRNSCLFAFISKLGLSQEIMAETVQVLDQHYVTLAKLRSKDTHDHALRQIGLRTEVIAAVREALTTGEDRNRSFKMLRFSVNGLRIAEPSEHSRKKCIQISNFWLYSNGSIVKGGTARNPSGSSPPGEGPDQITGIMTGVLGKWLDFNLKPLIIEYPQIVSADSYTLVTANDFPERDPASWILECSMDGVRWDMLDVRANLVPPDRRLSLYPLFPFCGAQPLD